MMTANEAIEESIARNCVETCDDTEDNALTLILYCDDYSDAWGEREYWGVRDGQPWRVRVAG